jgi:MinD-like ATPase involved in chromosome partitioning or flagellar assembly
VLFDCPPSLGLLALNALAAADEVFLVVQTQFLALQGMSKLVEVIQLVKQRLHPGLRLSGIIPCLYDSRMRLAREVLAELRRYFPTQVFRTPICVNVKLAEAPSFGKTIFEYAPESIGARDFASLAHEVMTQEVLVRPSVAAPPPAARRKRLAPGALAGVRVDPPAPLRPSLRRPRRLLRHPRWQRRSPCPPRHPPGSAHARPHPLRRLPR